MTLSSVPTTGAEKEKVKAFSAQSRRFGGILPDFFSYQWKIVSKKDTILVFLSSVCWTLVLAMWQDNNPSAAVFLLILVGRFQATSQQGPGLAPRSRQGPHAQALTQHLAVLLPHALCPLLSVHEKAGLWVVVWFCFQKL
jgi:hypothetical protein